MAVADLGRILADMKAKLVVLIVGGVAFVVAGAIRLEKDPVESLGVLIGCGAAALLHKWNKPRRKPRRKR